MWRSPAPVSSTSPRIACASFAPGDGDIDSLPHLRDTSAVGVRGRVDLSPEAPTSCTDADGDSEKGFSNRHGQWGALPLADPEQAYLRRGDVRALFLRGRRACGAASRMRPLPGSGFASSGQLPRLRLRIRYSANDCSLYPGRTHSRLAAGTAWFRFQSPIVCTRGRRTHCSIGHARSEEPWLVPTHALQWVKGKMR